MNYHRIRPLAVGGACLLFCLFVVLFEFHEKGKAQDRIDDHSRIIAEAMWNFNEQGTKEYLRLAARSHHYSSLVVTHNDGEIFQRVESAERNALDRFLIRIRLIPQVGLLSHVTRNGNIIGWVEAVWLPRTIYVHAYVLFAMLLATAVVFLYLRVLGDKVILEKRVLERTVELAKSNRFLQQEITERKRAEENLRKYEHIVASSTDLIALVDRDFIYMAVNESFTRAFGMAREEILGRPVSSLLGELKFTKDLKERYLRCLSGREVHFKTWCDFPIAGQRYMDVTYYPFFEREGEVSGIVVNSRDVTDTKTLEEQLIQAQKMEAVGTLAGGLAHDFNNLLMGISGRVSLVMADTDDSHPHREHLLEMEKHIRSAAELTRQLLGYAKGGKYEVKPVCLNDLIETSASMFGRTRKEITVETRLQEGIWSVEADRAQIEQVFMNLYLNAWQAMPEGGNLRIESRNVTLEEEDVRPWSAMPGKYVMTSVSDSGVGMDRATRERIFEPFFTTKEMGRGTGLGLASTYGIIRNHNGIIEVVSEKGDGSIFHIFLPASERTAEAVVEKNGRPAVGGTETVLLVDDEEMIADVGEQLLSKLGYEVILAANGTAAIEQYLHHRERISMVILDMVMPDMDGGETFDRLKTIDPAIRVLLSSGYSLSGKAKEIMERGCNGFIQKPFNMELLSRKVREVLDREPVES